MLYVRDTGLVEPVDYTMHPFSADCISTLTCRIPSMSFFGWRNWIWYGHPSHFQDQRGVSRPNDVDILSLSFS